MRKLKVEVQLSIDGFIATPEGRTDWMVWNWNEPWSWDPELQQYHTSLAESSDCILISSKMAVEGFVHHWMRVSADRSSAQQAFAQKITDARKLVLTNTLERSEWPNTELLETDQLEAIRRLKRDEGGDILAYGGAMLIASLLRAGLVDELHLFVNPTVLGEGIPLFGHVAERLDFKLDHAIAYGCGVSVLKYSKPS